MKRMMSWWVTLMATVVVGVQSSLAAGTAIPPPGSFAKCSVISYSENQSTTAAQQASSSTKAPRRLLSAAPAQPTVERSWVLRSSSNSNVTYAVKQTLNAASGGEISMCAYSPNRVLATLAPGKRYADFEAEMTSKGFRVVRELMKDLQGNSVYVIESTDTEHDVVEQMTMGIQSTGFCSQIRPDHIFSANVVPNDGKWADQWNMVKIGAPKAWNTRTDASSVLVAVLDTGVNFNHYDLNQNLWLNAVESADMGNGEDDDGNGIVDDVYGMASIGGNISGNPYDDNSHGSHCAGIIGAVGNNCYGVAGVAWKAKIMGLKFLDAGGSGSVSDAITCLVYAAQKGVKIVSCSFGSTQFNGYLYEQIEVMARQGVIFVCAAGNLAVGEAAEFANNDDFPCYPASCPCSNIVAVAATDRDDNLASFSHYGERSVDIAAPGVDIESTVLGSMAYGYKSGTSMATPHVAGALALLMAEYPDESPYDIVERLYAAGEEVASLKGKVRTGKRLSLENFFGLPAPSAVTASQGTIQDAVGLYWTAVANATHYRVWRAETVDGTKTSLCEWMQGLTFSDETALAGSNYWYFVQAAASAEGADASAYSEGVPGFRPEIPENRVTVTFNANGGAVAESKRNYTAGDTYGEFPAATYSDRVFLGWHTAATGGTRVDNVSIVRQDVTTLYAHWSGADDLRVENLAAQQRYPWNGKVDVMFDLNGVPEKEYASLALTAIPAGEGASRPLSTDELIPIPLVTYDGNAPTNLAAGAHRVVWNADADKPNALFENLTLNATASIDVPRAPASGTASNNVAAGGIDLAWTAAHGASSYEIWRSTSSTLGSAAKLLDCAELTCLDGSCTMGTYYYYWIKSKSSGGTSPDALALEAQRGNPTVTQTFNGNGGTPASQSQGYTANEPYGSFPAPPTRAGYTFAGWYTAASGGSQVTTSSIVPSANTTLYAHWSGNSYTISFNANGGSGSMSNLSMVYGTAKNLPANVFTRTGYTFAGWATSSSGSVAYVNGASVNNLTTASGGTVVLYAKWTPISYTIRFNANGGSGSMSDLPMTYDVAKNLPANAFTLTGYSFAGWATSSGGSVAYNGGASVNSLTTTAGAVVNLYAKWSAIVPTAPSSVSATDGTYSDKVTVSWSTVSGATTYYVYRYTSNSSGSATQIGSTSSTSYNDTSAVAGTTYWYWVKAYRSDNSQYSAFSTGDSGYVKEPVVSLAEAVDNLTLTLTTGGGADWVADKSVSYAGGSSAKSGAISDGQSSWMQTTVAGPGPFSFRWKVSCEASYDTFAWSLDGTEQEKFSGESDWKQVTKELTSGTHTIRWTYKKDESGKGGSDCGWVDTVVTPLAQPTNVSAGDGTATASVKITWTASAEATGYTIWRAATNDTAKASQIGTVTASSYTDNTGTPGVRYYYWVRATDGTRTSAFGTPDTGYRALAVPTSVTASDNTLAVGVRITWNAVEGADSYAIYRGTLSSSGSATQIGTSMGPAYIDSDVATGTTYYYFIKAVASASGTTSDFSSYDKGSRKAGEPLYVVVDLSGGTTAANYPISELNAAPSGGWTDEYKTSKLVLRRIPNGVFTMGCETSEVGYYGKEAQPHQVTISKPFYMSVFEITQKQYELLTGLNPSSYMGDARPVENVSYNMIRGSLDGAKWPLVNSVDSDSFMGRIRTRTGLTFDLPTEAQWEYACRAGTTKALNSGKNLTSTSSDSYMAEVGRYYYNSSYWTYDGKGQYSQHAVVGSYLPNNWGLYDMHGNVWELCLDWYVSRGTSGFDTAAVTDPKGMSSGSYRVIRGGAWYDPAQNCRSAGRYDGTSPSYANYAYGFRLCSPAGLMQNPPKGVSATDGTTADGVKVTWNWVGASSLRIWRGVHNASGAAEKIATVDGGSESYTDTSAKAGIVYWYWVEAVNGSYSSGFTAWDTGYRKLGSPSGVSATAGTGENTISWSEVADATSYKILRGTSSTYSSATQIGTVTTATFSDATALPGQGYYYWVVAVNEQGESAPSSYVYTSGWQLAAPTGVSASDGTYYDKVVVSWGAVTGASAYYIYRYTSNNSGSATQIGSSTTTSYEDKTAVAGTTYYYWIKAYNADSKAYSGWSLNDTGWRPVPLQTALDCTSLEFTTGGDAEWIGVTDVSYDGTDSARSGKIDHNQSTWLQTTVTGPALLSFRWKVSSEEGRDKLTFTIDGRDMDSISGTSMASFEQKTYEIESGTHTIKWTYSKDGNSSLGLDACWVDALARTTVDRLLNGPTGVTATDGTVDGGVLVSWDAVAGATSYSVYRTTYNTTFSGQKIGTTSALSYKDDKVDAGSIYYYRVYACNVAGASYRSSNTDGGFWSLPLECAVDSTGLSLTTGGDATWIGGGARTNADVRSSQNMMKGQTSWLRTTVNGPGVVQFDVNCASVSRASGVLTFLIDGIEIANTSNSNFRTSSQCRYVDGGSHTVEWRHTQTKDYAPNSMDIASPSRISHISFGKAVSGITASNGEYADGVTLSWPAVSGASSYEVWRCGSDKFSSAELVTTTSSRTFKDTWHKGYYWIKVVGSPVHSESVYAKCNPLLLSLSIEGPSTIPKGCYGSYEFYAHYSDGSKKTVTSGTSTTVSASPTSALSAKTSYSAFATVQRRSAGTWVVYGSAITSNGKLTVQLSEAAGTATASMDVAVVANSSSGTYIVFSSGNASCLGVAQAVNGVCELPANISGYKVTSIANDAQFPRGSSGEMTKLILPEGLTGVGEYTGNSSLGVYTFMGVEIVLPSTLRSVGMSAFKNCGNTTLVFPERMWYLGGFDGCAASSVTLPRVMEYSDGTPSDYPSDCLNYFMRYCPNLTELTVPEGWSDFACYNSFQGCKKLQTVRLPSTLKWAVLYFFDCSALTTFVVDANNPLFTSVDGVVYSKDMTELWRMPPGKTGDYHIPEGVTACYGQAFKQSKVDTLYIPASLVGDIDGHPDWVYWSESAIKRYVVDPANPVYSSKNGVLYDKSGTMVYHDPNAK